MTQDWPEHIYNYAEVCRAMEGKPLSQNSLSDCYKKHSVTSSAMTHAHTDTDRHTDRQTNTHTRTGSCKQLACAEEKIETLMQLAVSLATSCRCLLSSCRCSLSSCRCCFCFSKSNTWPTSLFFSSRVAVALHLASSLLCWADWLSAWRPAISCRQRTVACQVTGSCIDVVRCSTYTGAWY